MSIAGQGKTKVLGQKPVSVLLHSPQILHTEASNLCHLYLKIQLVLRSKHTRSRLSNSFN